MAIQNDPSLEHLYTAMASPLGIVLEVSNFALAQQRLYTARRKSGDPDLDVLQFRRSPVDPERELWIVKSGKISFPVSEDLK